MASSPHRCISSASSGSHPHCISSGSSPSLLRCFSSAWSSWLLLRIPTALSLVCFSTSLGPCPHHGSTASPQPFPLLRFSASPRPCPNGSISDSPRPRPLHCCTASPRPCPHHCFTASPWHCLLRCIRSCLYRCSSSASASCLIRFWPPLSPGRSSPGGGGSSCLFRPRCSSPRRLAASCPWIVQSGGLCLLLLVPPRMFQSGCQPATCQRMIQSMRRPLLLLGPPRMLQSRGVWSPRRSLSSFPLRCFSTTSSASCLSSSPRAPWAPRAAGLRLAWRPSPGLVLLSTASSTVVVFRVVRAVQVWGTRQQLLLGTWSCVVVVAGREPLWRASWPAPVRRASSGPVALGALVGFSVSVVPSPTLAKNWADGDCR